MTEKQGGSDVRANTTRATPNADGSYTLIGHKWFTSAPMSRPRSWCWPRPRADCPASCCRGCCPTAPATGCSCSGSRTSSATSPTPPVGDRIRQRPRVAGRRGGPRCADHHRDGQPHPARLHAGQRRPACAPGRPGPCTTLSTARRSAHYLIDQPLMRNVLADLAVEAEAATIVAMRMAGATDARRARRRARDAAAPHRPGGQPSTGCASARRPTPPRRWNASAATATSRSPACRGCTGEAPLMGIWEGSGNVSALDTLRAMATRPECIDVLFDELAKTDRPRPATGRPRRRAQGTAGRPGDHSVPGAQGRRGHQPRAAGLAAGAPRPPGGGRGVPGHPDGRPVGQCLRHAAAGLDLAPILERAMVKG